MRKKVDRINNHSNHSFALRTWSAKPLYVPTPGDNVGDIASDIHTLKSPHAGYAVVIHFKEIIGKPDVIRVFSTNWRCEHEPSGYYVKEDCRKFYRHLLNLGFVVG